MIRSSARFGHRFGLVLAAAFLFGGSRGVAQTAGISAARATVDSFFAVIAGEKWDSAAAMLDLARFERFFKSAVANARSAIPQRPMTVEDLMATDSTMPRAVAEWQIGQMKKSGAEEPFNYLSMQFAGITSPRDLFALSIPAAAARWLEAQDERTQMREAWRRSGCPLSDLPAFLAAKRTVLAAAAFDDSTVYVVQSDDRFGSMGPENLTPVERVMKLHRANDRWRIEPREDLLRPGGAYGYGFDCPKARRP
jgi:hypothetical protein